MLNDFDKSNINQYIMNTFYFLIGQRIPILKTEDEVRSVIDEYIKLLCSIFAIVQLDGYTSFGLAHEQTVSMIEKSVREVIYNQINLNNLMEAIKARLTNSEYTIH